MIERSRADFLSTAVVVLAFGVAMGFLEAAVVVYLRAALGIVPANVPAHDPATLGTFEAIEVARELATLVMIGAIGWLAGRTRLERLAWAAVVFGTWDIVYYLGLRGAVGWPSSFDTWDVLFLVPVAWVGPVWAPIVVSAALIAFGLAAARHLRVGRPVVAGPVRTIGALAGGSLVILSFLVDTNRVLAGDSAAWTGWWIFWAGMALATAATVSALAGKSTVPVGRMPAFSMEPETGRRSAPRTDQPIPTTRFPDMVDKVKDPVCGMEIHPENAAATEEHEGRTFYFCSRACHDAFVNDPHAAGMTVTASRS